MSKQHQNDTSTKVTREFAKRRLAITRLAITVMILTGVILLMAYAGLVPKFITALMLGLFFVYGAIVNVWKWRCPSCNGHLGKLYLGLKEPKYCPGCGIKLIEE